MAEKAIDFDEVRRQVLATWRRHNEILVYAHESHHRGQIMLALKQSGIRLPEAVALQGVWGKWI